MAAYVLKMLIHNTMFNLDLKWEPCFHVDKAVDYKCVPTFLCIFSEIALKRNSSKAVWKEYD